MITLNRTPTASESATALAPKTLGTLLSAFILLALIVCGAVLWNQKSQELIYLDAKPVLVEVARSEKMRTKGLSDRTSLANGHGMLFVFDEPSAACMWMKDMSFGLDVYWYSATGNLINSYKNLQPDTFPSLYCPELPASYMLEVNYGEFEKVPKKLVVPQSLSHSFAASNK